jgi:hypothetical protein
LNSVNTVIFLMVKCGAVFEIRTKFLKIVCTRFGFKGLIVFIHSNDTVLNYFKLR